MYSLTYHLYFSVACYFLGWAVGKMESYLGLISSDLVIIIYFMFRGGKGIG